jgi:vancomycin resistance protein YoaR
MSFDPNVQSRFSTIEKWCLAGSLVLLISAATITTLLYRHYQNKFYPGVVIDGISANGKTKSEIKKALLERENTLPGLSLTLHVDGIQVASSGAELGAHFDYDTAIEKAFSEKRQGNIIQKAWRLVTPWPKTIDITSEYQLDRALLTNQISSLAIQVDDPAEEPSASLKISEVASSLKLLSGKSGRMIHTDQTIEKVSERLQPGELHVPAVVASISAGLSPEQLTPSVDRAKKYVGKKIIFRADNVFREMNDQLIINVLAFPDGVSSSRLQPVIDELAKEVNRPPQNAEFEFDQNSLKVTKFSAPRKGLGLNTEQLVQDLKAQLSTLESTEQKTIEIKLPVKETDPEKGLGDTNTLGIKERIGFGDSQYAHSIPNRVHNVALTATRINNYIIKPDEEFSFNKAVGDVSAATGFKSAYVIINGRTELGDGGGVCQVSTTLFRAVLNAGLPVTKRKPHSYRVSYYEQNAKPGIDATVYTGEVDLRFKNDTGHHILVHTQTDSQKLYMNVELYGTSDGRTTEIVDHKTWDFRGAPPPLYIDDPSVPKGRVRQIDFATSGVKASFKNIVKDKNGNLIREDEYYSNYVPWRAVFLRGI